MMQAYALKNKLIEWLDEDMPFGDITTDALNLGTNEGRANLIAKADGIICGLFVFNMVFEIIDKDISIKVQKNDGTYVKTGDLIAEITGPLQSILKGERLALNLLQRLSGIATETAKYVEAVGDTTVRVVDTRKTTPGLRMLEKMAVKCGGGTNHRFSLSDAVMIKDNHITATGGILNAVESIRKNVPYTAKIEVEVDSLEMLSVAVTAGVDIIMLDNMSLETMREAVTYIKTHAKKDIMIEASGNMTLERVRDVSSVGVDVISVGALTHSVKALDISLKF